MRDVVNKNVTEEQLIETARARVLARLVDKHEALLHDRPADRGGRGRARHRRRPARARWRSAAQLVGQARRGHGAASARTCPSRTRRSSGARMDTLAEIARKQRLLRDAARGATGVDAHACTTSTTQRARGHPRARRPPARATCSSARAATARASTRWDEQLKLDVWDEAFAALRRRSATLPRHAPGDGARCRGTTSTSGSRTASSPREYRKALQEPPQPAVRQGRRHVHPPHEPRGRRGRRAQARLLRLRRRLRPDADARASASTFLQRLGAVEPSERARLPIAAGATRTDRPSSAKPRTRSLPPARAPAARRERYRLRFEKTGPAALLGHLDLVRELPRVMRRAGAAHRLQRGLPPEARHELRAGALARRREPRRVRRREAHRRSVAGRAARGGSSTRRAAACASSKPRLRARAKDPSIAGDRQRRDATSSRCAESALGELGGRAGLEALVRAFLEKTELRVRRNIEGLGKLVDVRALHPLARARRRRRAQSRARPRGRRRAARAAGRDDRDRTLRARPRSPSSSRPWSGARLPAPGRAHALHTDAGSLCLRRQRSAMRDQPTNRAHCATTSLVDDSVPHTSHLATLLETTSIFE